MNTDYIATSTLDSQDQNFENKQIANGSAVDTPVAVETSSHNFHKNTSGKRHAMIVKPDSFERENHFYPKVINAQLTSEISHFMLLNNDRIITRYCHIHPHVNIDTLTYLLSYEPKYFAWSGADLFNVTTMNGHRRMCLIETNSCPSGQKSMPCMADNDELGSYRLLIEKTFKPMVEERQKKGLIPKEGRLAVVYDKNKMEASGYACLMADVFQEEVLLVEWYDKEKEVASVRFNKDHIMEVQDEQQQWHPIRACFRYLTQKPWNRLPLVSSKTFIFNPTMACIAGGRNKITAAKAYEFFNIEYANADLKINMPKTIYDVERNLVPLYVKSFGGFAVIKNPYSNAGQGVWTITSQQELDHFMKDTESDYNYTHFIVQSLIGNSKWSSLQQSGTFYHVGSVPDKKREIFVSDLRMMIHYNYETKGWGPVALYARRAALPLADDPKDKNSWDMLGTNLTFKKPDGSFDTDTKRLIIMDRRDFHKLGLGLDDIIDAFIQSVLATVAIDKIAKRLLRSNGEFDLDLYRSLNNDENLIKELVL